MIARVCRGLSTWQMAQSSLCFTTHVQRVFLSTETSDPQRIRVYTRTGDKGSSSLFNGERRPKSDPVFEALGTTDELSAHLGLAKEFCVDSNLEALVSQIETIQTNLLDIGSNIATPISNSNEARLNRTQFDERNVVILEQWIDEMDNQLPPLKNFILPGGGKTASSLHIARAVCRRAERSVIPLHDDISESVQKYLNRLSDFLFVSARFASFKENHAEAVYKKK